MQALILIIHVLVAISLIGLVLLQHGKGADVGASFGSGSSNTMFGSTGSLPFLIKVTAILAAIFFATSVILSYMATPHVKTQQQSGATSGLEAPVVPAPSSGGSSTVPVQNQ